MLNIALRLVMKVSLIFVLAAILTSAAHAEFTTWTNSAGQTAELQLTDVKEMNGELVGTFRTRDWGIVRIRQSELSAEDGKRLQSKASPMRGDPSVFDDFLWGNLVKLEGGDFEQASFSDKPEKYYVFYYTASWCGPCRRFTPSLVEWYNDNKNGNFEVFLVTSDRGETAMKDYAKKNDMPWPMLGFDKTRAFKEAFRDDHGVRGIPSLIVCDADGKVLGNYRSQLSELSRMVK